MTENQKSAIRQSVYALKIAEIEVEGLTEIERVYVLSGFVSRSLDRMRADETRNNEGQQ